MSTEHGHSPTALHTSGSQLGVVIWSKLEKSVFPEARLGKFWMGTSDGDVDSQVHETT